MRMRWLSSILVALSLAASCGDDKPAKGESQTCKQLAARLADINERLSSARHRAIDVADHLAQARTELTQHPTPAQTTELTKKIDNYTQQNTDLGKEIDGALLDQHKLMKDLAAQEPACGGSGSAPPP